MPKSYLLTIARLFALFVLYAAAAPLVHALDPAVGLAGYRHERWGEVDGAPSLIDAIAQTEDGWLWVASRNAGLYRFDGVRFIPNATIDGSRLQSTSISVLQPGDKNTLWIGHGIGGVSVLRDHRLRHLLTPEMTSSVFAIARGRDNSVWVASAGGLFLIRDDKAIRMDAGSGYPSASSNYVMVDSQDRVWSSDVTSLYVLEQGQTRFRQVRAVEKNPMLIEAPDGSVWVVLGKRYERLTAAATRPPPRRASGANSYQSGFDGDGNLWSGNCPQGLCVVRPGTWKGKPDFDAMASTERFDQAWQMTSLRVNSVYNDREGNVWVGTAAGLERLRDQPVHMLDASMDRGTVHALPHPDGRIVVLESHRFNGTLTLSDLVDGKLVNQKNPLGTQVMCRAPDGSLVLAGAGGIERQYAGSVMRFPLPPLPLPALETIQFQKITAGNDQIVVRISGQGVWRFHHGEWKKFQEQVSEWRGIAIDRAGRAYFGGGARLSSVLGEAVTDIDTAHADVGTIRLIHAADAVFVSGTRGVGLVKDNRLHLLSFTASSDIIGVSGSAKGPGGTHWLNTSHGLLQVAAADWSRTMQDPSIPMKGDLRNALDGYPGGGEILRLNDTVFLAADGKLWLAGERGLAWMAPGALQPNRIGANTEILGLIANGRRHAPASAITLGNGMQNLQIDYSAPSLRVPQRVRFRYRMVGADRQWVDAGTRRTAFYQNLAPGNYRFEVMAINEDGVPSPQAAILRLAITPHLTQTWWFYTLCVGVGIIILYGLYRIRVRRLAARLEERYAIRTNERESIARGLHDTFLQSLQGLFMSMQAVVATLPPDGAARTQFGLLIDRARRVLAEGRDEVTGLRGEFSSGLSLWEALQRDIAIIVPDSDARVRMTGLDETDQLDSHLHHNVYAIVREAVVNALRHTQGDVVVDASGTSKAFVLSVTDSGNGLGEFKAGKQGHFGLQGMREHAAQIGARLEIDDVAGGGTRVTLTLPAKLASKVRPPLPP